MIALSMGNLMLIAAVALAAQIGYTRFLKN